MAHPPAPFQQAPAGQDGFTVNALEGRQVGTIGADHLWRYDYDHYPPPGRNALGSPQALPPSPPTSQALQKELANSRQPRDELTGDWAARVLDLTTRAFPDYTEEQVQRQAVLQFCQGCYDREGGAYALNHRPKTVKAAKELVVWRKCAYTMTFSRARKDVRVTSAVPQPPLEEIEVCQAEVPPKFTPRQSCPEQSPGGQQPPKPAQRSPEKPDASGNQEKCGRDEGGHDAGFASLQGAVESQAAVMETWAAQQAAQAAQIAGLHGAIDTQQGKQAVQIAGLRGAIDAQQGKQAAQIAGLRDAIAAQQETQAVKLASLQGVEEIQAAKIASLQDAILEKLRAQQATEAASLEKLHAQQATQAAKMEELATQQAAVLEKVHAQQAAQTARVDKLQQLVDHLTQAVSQLRPWGKSPSPPPALSKKLCYRCGKLGHLRKDCPSPRSPRSLAFMVDNAVNCSGPDKEATPSPARQMSNPGDMITQASPPTVPLLVRPQFVPRKGPNTPCSNMTPSLSQESTPCPCPRPAPRTSSGIFRPQPAPRYSLSMPQLGTTPSPSEAAHLSQDLPISGMDYEVFVTMDTPALQAAKFAARSHPSSAPGVARQLFEQEPCTSTPVHPPPPDHNQDPPTNFPKVIPLALV